MVVAEGLGRGMRWQGSLTAACRPQALDNKHSHLFISYVDLSCSPPPTASQPGGSFSISIFVEYLIRITFGFMAVLSYPYLRVNM